MIMNYAPGGCTQLPRLEDVIIYKQRMQTVQSLHRHRRRPRPAGDRRRYYLDLADDRPGRRQLPDLGGPRREEPGPLRPRLPARRHLRRQPRAGEGRPQRDQDVHQVSRSSRTRSAAGKHPLDVGPGAAAVRRPGPHRRRRAAQRQVRLDAGRPLRRTREVPMEVGPLAADARWPTPPGGPRPWQYVDRTLAAVGAAGKPEVLISALGRIAARVIKAQVNMDNAQRWADDLLANLKAGDTAVNSMPEVPDRARATAAGTRRAARSRHYCASRTARSAVRGGAGEQLEPLAARRQGGERPCRGGAGRPAGGGPGQAAGDPQAGAHLRSLNGLCGSRD